MAKQLLGRWVVPTLLWILRAMTPARRHVVLFGFPSTEGNVVETVRGLLQRYAGEVVWLDAPSNEYCQELGLDPGAIRSVRRLSLPGMWLYIRAEAVFFTHGLYGIPRTVRRKPTFNLWHGEGIKDSTTPFPGRRVGGKPADYLIACTRQYSAYFAKATLLQEEDIILSGYPRNDELFRPCSDEKLRQMSIDPAMPFVVWMPSFRNSVVSGVDRTYRDAGDLTQDEALGNLITAGADVLATHGIQFVVKAHPADSMSRGVVGATTIDDSDLFQVGASLYSVLGRSAGLITDVSSVLFDYLLLDRPIAYFFPDLDEYLQGRGVWTPEVLNHLAGPLIATEDEFSAWSAEVLGRLPGSSDQRKDASEWIGLIHTRDATKTMLSLIRAEGRSPFSHALAAPSHPEQDRH